MLTIVGTIPEEDKGLLMGMPDMKGEMLIVDGVQIPINRGTPALVGAAIKAAEVLCLKRPSVILAGDTGLGRGSRLIYEYLVHALPKMKVDTLAFHYLLPDVDWHNRIMFSLQEMRNTPLLIADAGYMYVAKMSGFAPSYDLFTPDVGELAFLADEEAPHPFYTRGFLLYEDEKVPELIRRAYTHGNASRFLLVKGKVDYVAKGGEILSCVREPSVEALEPIGGTGDTLTGLVSVLADSGMELAQACTIAAKANRIAGLLANPDPSTQVIKIIEKIPEALGMSVQSMS